MPHFSVKKGIIYIMFFVMIVIVDDLRSNSSL